MPRGDTVVGRAAMVVVSSEEILPEHSTLNIGVG